MVDGCCRPVAEYENRETGDRQNWPDASAVRIRLRDRYYDVTANGGGSIVRIGFESVTP